MKGETKIITANYNSWRSANREMRLSSRLEGQRDEHFAAWIKQSPQQPSTDDTAGNLTINTSR